MKSTNMIDIFKDNYYSPKDAGIFLFTYIFYTAFVQSDVSKNIYKCAKTNLISTKTYIDDQSTNMMNIDINQIHWKDIYLSLKYIKSKSE